MGQRTIGAALLAAALLAVPLAAQDDEEDEITGFGVLAAELAGSEIPGGGDMAAKGAFRVEIDAGAGDFCYVLNASGLKDPGRGALWKGAAGETGKKVFDLERTGDDGDLCRAELPKTVKPVLDNPAGYYVVITSAAFPKGAIRGQLSAVEE